MARLHALNIGWYQVRYGEVPQDALDEETLALLSAGMQNLVPALTEVAGLNDDLEDEPRH